MIVFAILGTVLACVWTFVVLWANGMRSSPGEFFGRWTIFAAWAGVVVLWLAWLSDQPGRLCTTAAGACF